MRSSVNFALLAVGMLLAGVEVAACTLDLQGLRGGATATGDGGAMATSSASGSANGGGGSGGTSSATGTGGRGGSMPVCGDGTIEGKEECDDSNQALGDGCSPTCAVEPLDTCPGLPISLEPSTLILTGTLASASNDLKPSCGATNGADVVYEVTPTTSGTLKLTLSGAYDKTLSVRSSCGDSATAELGCEAGVGDLQERRWVYANVRYYVVVDADHEAFTLRLDLTPCGDGIRQELEQCDSASCPGCFLCDGVGEILDQASGHCYRRVANQQKNWPGARADCLAWGGDLVGISSAAEATFLHDHFKDTWTGANDGANECSFSWINGEPWQPHWAPKEPNNNGDEDCGFLYDTGLMNDTKCKEAHDALCERAPGGSCGDGVVQPGEECDDKLTYAHVTCVSCAINCPADEIEDPATHHCYRVVTGNGVTWDAAQSDCAATGAYLATVSSPAENALFLGKLNGPKWIGASRDGDKADFKWLNTDAFCWANWPANPGNDDKHCTTLQPSGTWTNDDCAQIQGYICERDN